MHGKKTILIVKNIFKNMIKTKSISLKNDILFVHGKKQYSLLKIYLKTHLKICLKHVKNNLN